MSIIARQTATRHSGHAGQHARLGVASGAAAPPKGTVRVSCQHVGLDAGYAPTAIAKGLEERGIYGVDPAIGARTTREGLSPKRSFSTQRTGQLYRSKWALTDRPHRASARLWHYRACQLRCQCTRNRNLTKNLDSACVLPMPKQLHRHRYAFMPVVWPKCASTAGNTTRNLEIIALLPSRMRRLSHIYGCYLSSSAN